MANQLVITIISDDRPGIVDKLAAVISGHQGNWLESALSRLGGKFAGILLAEVPPGEQASLEQALKALAGEGIRVSIDQAGQPPANGGREADFEVVGNDRRGIVGEISRALAAHGVSVDELYTDTERAPMSGELLFRARAKVILPGTMTTDELQSILERLSDDLMVEFPES